MVLHFVVLPERGLDQNRVTKGVVQAGGGGSRGGGGGGGGSHDAVCPGNNGIYRTLNGKQTVGHVTINFYCALLNTSGTYIAQFYIQNNSDLTFLSMPVNARVFDANGDRVTARVNVDRIGTANQTARGMIVEPGATLRMTVTIIDRRWVENYPQGLVLQIQEDSRSRRLFQVPF